MSKKDQQQEEIELLQNIIFDKMKVVESEPDYIVSMDIKADFPEAKMKFVLVITLNDEYPDKEPTFTLEEVNNYLASSKLNELREKLKSLCTEYINMPMMYQMFEFISGYAQEEEEKLLNEEKEVIKLEEEKKLLEQKQKEEEEKLLQQRTYTPVTKELFEEWYSKFVKQKHEEMKKNILNAERPTGIQFFLNKNIKTEEAEEDKVKKDEEEDNKVEDTKDEENVEYNPELYEEDIGNIDFEKDDIDIDSI